MDSGTHLVMPGEGNGGSFGGPPGDLYIVLAVRPHEVFHREGYDLHLEVPISFVQASLGTHLTIPTLKDSRELVIPPGTQPGETIRIKGEGVPYPKGSRKGDLLVQVRVVVPRSLTPRSNRWMNWPEEGGGPGPRNPGRARRASQEAVALLYQPQVELSHCLTPGFVGAVLEPPLFV
jgi:DnaJ-class molecular chaperone